MKLSYKARKRLSLLILIAGVPIYIVCVITVLNLFDRPPILVEFLVYLFFGVLWALPLKAVFKGIGQSDPGAGPKP